MSSEHKWMTWQSAQRVWASYTKHGNTVHSPESIFMAYLGLPVAACDYTTPLDDRRS